MFFPAYNDAPSLPLLLSRTFRVLRQYVTEFEVIVVNDGSRDETAAVLDALCRDYSPHLRVVTHEQNRGYGSALRSGFAAATKEWVFYTDGDGQYDPSELVHLLKAVTCSTGLVNGYKIQRSDAWRRVAIGWMYNRFARFLFGVKVRDIDCDFRLIRRSLVEACPLQSTSGAVCLEMVRKIERQDVEVVEVPVHHYPRTHGRSQFFRVQSLLSTFLQLCRLFLSLLLLPALRRVAPEEPRDCFPGGRFVAGTVCAIALLSFLPYLRALGLPLIADDYLQIQLARDFAPQDGWRSLAADALYRCRATSLFLTFWTERAFGVSVTAFAVSSVLIHFMNAILVFGMGFWRVVGWRVAAFSACFFAFSQHHQEAVIWYAAVPELLVFLFAMSSFLCWVRWLQSGGSPAYIASLGLFILALFSKESGVAALPLFALAIALERKNLARHLLGLLPACMLGIAYFAMTYAGRAEHQHFHDGTFQLSAPVFKTLLNSAARLLWVSGAVSLAALAIWKAKHWWRLVAVSLIWMAVTLMPYSFLTYMPRVPSRHTYFASVGSALIVAIAFVELRRRSAGVRRRWVPVAIAAAVIISHASYLWVWKHAQFEQRARPTEMLIEAARRSTAPLYIRCFPYSRNIAENALRIRLGVDKTPVLILGAAAREQPAALDLCNEVAYERRGWNRY